uniref:BACK domain-containing protein n=1 Tax=Parastrongyloides trichosuri TaxID=131310 RepID=A0A0N4ZZZ4_PARTI
MDYEYIIYPYDNLTHDVVLIAEDITKAVTTQSLILATQWLNLFDADYRLEFRNYNTFERLFIYTDLKYDVINCIITFLHERKIIYNGCEEMAEVINVAERFSLTKLVKSCLMHIHTISMKNNKYLFWGWKLGKRYNDQNRIIIWRKILYVTPKEYKNDKELMDGFLELDYQDLITFLRDSRLNVWSEREVLEMGLFWYKHNEKRYDLEYKIFLDDLFKCFKINLRTERDFFEELIAKYYPEMDKVQFTYLEVDKLRCPRDVMVQVGGVSANGLYSRLQMFDTRKGSWIYIRGINLPQGIANFASVVKNSKIYICGGSKDDIILNDVYELDMNTLIWSRKSSMHYPRTFHQLIVYNGEIYAIGGKTSVVAQTRLASFEKYNPEKNIWTVLKPMPVSRSDFGAVVVKDNLIVSGGFNGEEILFTSNVYNFTTEEWKDGPVMGIPRKGHALVLWGDDKIVAIGGNFLRNRLVSCEATTLDGSYFEEIESLAIGRSNFAVAVYRGKIYVCGGFTHF